MKLGKGKGKSSEGGWGKGVTNQRQQGAQIFFQVSLQLCDWLVLFYGGGEYF